MNFQLQIPQQRDLKQYYPPLSYTPKFIMEEYDQNLSLQSIEIRQKKKYSIQSLLFKMKQNTYQEFENDFDQINQEKQDYVLQKRPLLNQILPNEYKKKKIKKNKKVDFTKIKEMLTQKGQQINYLDLKNKKNQNIVLQQERLKFIQQVQKQYGLGEQQKDESNSDSEKEQIQSSIDDVYPDEKQDDDDDIYEEEDSKNDEYD